MKKMTKERSEKMIVTKKGIVAVALTLAMGISIFPNVANVGTPATVEAATKKDKKKPQFTFKGKTKMTATKDKSVTIPKVTAKDNKDGNVTKKIKVTVKKGKKSYSSIAKKIKNNKKVKFTATGKYTITYTVTDKAGNKATKKRYVTVKEAEKQNVAPTTEATTQQKPTPVEPTTEKVTTEAPTTEEPTTEKVTTEAKTTEQPTTETPTTEAPTVETPTDYSQYDIKEVTFDGNTYKVTRDEDFMTKLKASELNSSKIKFDIDNEYMDLYIDRKAEILTTSEYIKFLGKIKAYDENGNDISDSVVIYEKNLDRVSDVAYGYGSIYIYAEDKNGNKARSTFGVNFCDFDRNYDDYVAAGFLKISTNPIVFGELRTNTQSLSQTKQVSGTVNR